MIKINKNQLKREYLINKLTDYKIAKKFNCTPTWIRTLRKRFKIKSIKPYERNKVQDLSSQQKEVIYGSLLGDASIKFGGREGNKNAFLSISQTNKALTEFKYKIMNDFVKTGVKSYRDNRPKRKKMYYFNTISHPFFTNIYNEIYKTGVKTISKQWLDKLTPLGLAMWYFDDGSITKSTHQMRISTEGFSYKEHLLMKDYFNKKWKIKVDIKKSSRPNKYILSFRAKERNKFFKFIGAFIIPQMQYKICKNLKKWEKWSSSEIEYLTKNYKGSRSGWMRLQLVLDHSKQAIRRKASYLGLTRRELI